MNRSGSPPDISCVPERGISERLSAWAVALDALAGAAIVAAGATAVRKLEAETAHALLCPFADWAFVDMIGSQPFRAIAGCDPDSALARALYAMSADASPLIRAAVRQCKPLVQAPLDDVSALGNLPDGRSVVAALGADSAAVGPIVTSGNARGTITIARRVGRPYIGFLELGTLSHVADLAAAAVARLKGRNAGGGFDAGRGGQLRGRP